MAEIDLTNLPPNWDCKFDHRLGRHYYVNHFTKTTTWEDPRIKYKQLYDGSVASQNSSQMGEHIPLQPMHGSSPYHVYPAKNYPTVQAAFQGPSSGVPSLSASPQLAAKLQQLEMSPVSRASTNTVRSVSNLAKQNVQETSFSTAAADTENSVSKINSMFPTVPETHIRMLLKKYYNREAVVISALQVEKHPLTTPGPTPTPPPGRHFYNTSLGIASAFHMTPILGRDIVSRTGSPIPRPSSSCASGSYGSPRVGEGYRCSPKPHSSPKMKLRYLKGIFPKAEEVLILDVLANADNNVQKASEKLLSIGYEKRDTTGQKISVRKTEEEKAKKRELEKQAALPPKLKTIDEKNKMKVRLQNQYKTVAERIISMALESVDYSEDKACQILNIVMQEDDNLNKSLQQDIEDRQSTSRSQSSSRSSSKLQQQIKSNRTQEIFTKTTAQVAADQNINTADKDEHFISPTSGIRLKQSRPKAKNDHSKYSNSRVSPETDVNGRRKMDFKSLLTRTMISGPNSEILKGPNDDLLLVDYVTWRGANAELALGRKGLSCGSDPQLRTKRTYSPHGAKSDVYKGVNVGLAKGSIYSQINRGMTDVKVN